MRLFQTPLPQGRCAEGCPPRARPSRRNGAGRVCEWRLVACGLPPTRSLLSLAVCSLQGGRLHARLNACRSLGARLHPASPRQQVSPCCRKKQMEMLGGSWRSHLQLIHGSHTLLHGGRRQILQKRLHRRRFNSSLVPRSSSHTHALYDLQTARTSSYFFENVLCNLNKEHNSVSSGRSLSVPSPPSSPPARECRTTHHPGLMNRTLSAAPCDSAAFQAALLAFLFFTFSFLRSKVESASLGKMR
jgi:hypothetical protein